MQDAAVIPKPDPVVGEVPKAYVVKSPRMQISEEELLRFVEGEHLMFLDI